MNCPSFAVEAPSSIAIISKAGNIASIESAPSEIIIAINGMNSKERNLGAVDMRFVVIPDGLGQGNKLQELNI